MNKTKLSLKDAIFMNLNIMIGAGIIVNTALLTKTTGIFGSLSYLLLGIVMLPLIYCIGTLITRYPSGGFYIYTKNISPLVAFVTCWSYFFGKLASASLILYVSATFIKQLFPYYLGSIATVHITLVILTIFIYLNLFNLKTGTMVQQLFFAAKSIPILFVVIAGIMTLQHNALPETTFDFLGIASSIPFILYSLTGFEAACAMSRNIENPTKNAPKAIFYSFFIVVGIYVIFQLLMSIMLLPNIEHITSYKDAFSSVVATLSASPQTKFLLAQLINFVIGFATLGGAYGIVFSNSWNFYTLAEHGHTFAPKLFLHINKHQMPTATIVLQGIICTIFILITQGNQIPLQQTAALGTIIAYTISIIALLLQPASKTTKILQISALITCIGLLTAWATSAATYGITSLLLFSCMNLLGLFMYWHTKSKAAF